MRNQLIGIRVKAARETAGVTQDSLAAELGFNDRQTISDIENGKRALKAEELARLSDLLDRDLEYFVDPFVVAGEASFSWRAVPDASSSALKAFEERAGAWIGLLRWLRQAQPGAARPLKQMLRVSARSSFEEAQDRAEELVESLGLPPVPAQGLAERIESRLDIPVLFVDSPDDLVSGAACQLRDLSVILVNRRDPEGRRSFDLAHELFHVLSWDSMAPAARESNVPDPRARGRRSEQLADNFASALLMPRATLEDLVDRRRAGDVAHLRDVARSLRVTTAALGWRLLNLGWIDERVRQALQRERADSPQSDPPKRFSAGFAASLHCAVDRGRISARKAAKTMGLTLPELAALFAEHDLPAPFAL